MKFLMLLITLVLYTGCRNEYPVVSNFRFLPIQDETIPSVDQNNNWKAIPDTRILDMPYTSKDLYVYAWIKGEFIIQDPSRYYAILLGRTHDIDTTYINNTFIGTKKIKRLMDWYRPSQYIIPPKILKQGKNEILIRLGKIPGGRGGFTSIVLQTQNEYEKTLWINNLLYKQIFIYMIIIFTTMILIHLINYLIDRKEKMRLYLMSGLLINILSILTLIAEHEKINLGLMWSMLIAGIPIVLIFLLLLFQVIYRIFISNYNRIFIPIMLLFAAIINANGYHSFSLLTPYLALLSMLIGFPFLGYILYCLNKIKPNRTKLLFIIPGLTIMLVCWIWEIIASMMGLYFPGLLNIYLLPFYTLFFIIFEAIESKRKRIVMDRLYDRLKKLKPSKEERITITKTSEEKLCQIIEFINDNYTEDISREGLASAVDINPNYLSTLFNEYTGKKINEYINYLRIQEAAQQLKGTDAKIIDIAFSVGFESLSTFMRAFKTEIGVTPKKYRNLVK